MKKIALLMAVLVAFGTVCSAFELSADTLNEEALEKIKTSINEKTETVPGIRSFLGSERINFELGLKDGSSLIVGLENEKGKIKAIKSGGAEKPTIRAKVSQQTIEKVMESEDPFQTALDALNSGEIIFEAEGFFPKLKVSFIKFGMKLAGFIKKIAALLSKG